MKYVTINHTNTKALGPDHELAWDLQKVLGVKVTVKWIDGDRIRICFTDYAWYLFLDAFPGKWIKTIVSILRQSGYDVERNTIKIFNRNPA